MFLRVLLLMLVGFVFVVFFFVWLCAESPGADLLEISPVGRDGAEEPASTPAPRLPGCGSGTETSAPALSACGLLREFSPRTSVRFSRRMLRPENLLWRFAVLLADAPSSVPEPIVPSAPPSHPLSPPVSPAVSGVFPLAQPLARASPAVVSVATLLCRNLQVYQSSRHVSLA